MKRIVSFILVLCLLLSLCAFVGEGGDTDPESSPEAPVVCTCGQPDGVHTADCPLYIAPADEKDEPECTCGQPDGELHAEGCPLYIAPDEPIPTDPPVEEDPFDVAAAYEYIHSLGTYTEISEYLATLSEEQIAELEQYTAEVEGPFEPAPEFTKAGPIFDDGIVSALPVMRAFSLRSAVTGFEGKERVEPASGLNVGKTVTTTPKTDSAGNPIYQIDLTASAESNIVVANAACDIVLVLDRSGSMSGANITSLIDSVNGFLSTVQENSPDSRVAIVTYASQNASTIDTGTGYSDALIPITVSSTVNPALTSTVDGLSSRTNGGTYSDEGLEKAAKILQAVPANDPNYNNQRVVILFTDGIPGTGRWSDSESNVVAQNSIHWGKILKATKGSDVELDYGQGFYDGKSDASTFAGATTGCEAKVFCVGVGLRAANGDRSDGSKINEYLYRVSSHRSDGSHVGDVQYAWDLGLIHGPITADNRIIQNEWEKEEETWSYDYKDDLTRNRPEGSYYAVGTTSSLNSIFQEIAKQTGKSIENATIRDYITPGFDICDADGNVYQVGQTITNGSVTGTVKQDANGVYVEWTKIDLDPGDETGAGAKSFSQTIYLKPKAEFWGGNKVPTNIIGISGVYDKSGNNIGSFPEPAPVDVPVKKPEVTPTTSNIYFGGDTPAVSDLYDFTAPAEAWKTAYVDITLPQGVSVSNTADGKYDVTVTVSPKYEGTYTAQSTKVTSTVNVFEPVAQFEDSTIYLGDTPAYASQNFESMTWKHGDTAADDVIMIGSAPSVEYAYDIAAAAFTDCTAVQPTPKVNGTVCGSANDFTVHVLKPSVTVTLADTSAYYGDSYTPAGGSSSVSWDDGHSHTGIPAASGTAPYSSAALKYYSDAAKTTEMGTITMPNEDVKVYVKAFHGTNELSVTSFSTTCAVEGHKCDEHTGGYFTVHPLTCSLTITKDADALFGEHDSFIFTVTGDNATYPVSVKAVITGEGSTTIVGLPVGTYTVSEEGGWSWRYTADGTASDTVTKDDDAGEVTITNALTNTKWLSGSSVAVNTWTSTSITPSYAAGRKEDEQA